MTGQDRPERTALDWLFVAATLALAGVHLYLGLAAPFVPAERATQFALVALAFLAGVAVYFTRFWQPILYLLGVGFAAYLGVVWLLDGAAYFTLGVATGVLAVCFGVLATLLFARDSTRVEG